METPLVCTACGNRCMGPPTLSRDYTCPRCGRLLPRTDGARRRSLVARARAGLLDQAQYVLMLVLLFGCGAIAVRAGLLGYRSTASADEQPSQRPSQAYLTASENRNYDYRVRQLEKDLKRDQSDWEVLRRLGQLHLRLALGQGDRRGSHLRLARYYLQRAGPVAQTNRDAQIVRNLLDVANSPNPAPAMLALTDDFGRQRRWDEVSIRERLGWLEEQVALYPRNSRLLCWLGDNYVALLTIIERGRPLRMGRWPGASSVSDLGEAGNLAEQAYRRAIEHATTDEARCRAYYGKAQLYRAIKQPARAMLALHQLMRLQPNNWFASLEMATLCRQLNRPVEASRFQAQSARWRTPGWI